MRSVMEKDERSATKGRSGNWRLGAAVVATVAASACCLGPLVLLGLGISGAWISRLTALEPYRPLFIGLTLVFLGYAFYRGCTGDQRRSPASLVVPVPTRGRRSLTKSHSGLSRFWLRGSSHSLTLCQSVPAEQLQAHCRRSVLCWRWKG